MGKVERRHRHIVDTGLTLLAHAGLDFKYWHFAFETAVFLINRIPSSVNPKSSPYELIYHRVPDYSFLRSFGCLCFPYLRPYQQHKMSYRSSPFVFLGYSSNHNGYRCLCLSSGRTYLAKHVRFHEAVFPLSKPSLLGPPPLSSPVSESASIPFASASIDSLTPSQQVTTSASSPLSVNSAPAPVIPLVLNSRTSDSPTSTAPSTSPIPSAPHYRTRLTTNSLKPRVIYDPSAHLNIVQSSVEPTCFTQANSCPLWRAAMQEEINAMIRTNTWTLVSRTQSMNVIGCRWIFRLKRDASGAIVRRRARLVAKGNHQQEGVDFFDTLVPSSSIPPSVYSSPLL